MEPFLAIGALAAAYYLGWLSRAAHGPLRLPRYVMPRRWWRP
jgi:hypothetical protein